MMGIDVTGWYDDQTSIATGTLQGMYGVNNARDSVFGLNTWHAMESISNSPDRFWNYHEFNQEYKGNLAEARLMGLVGDLIVNAAIFGGGKALLSKLLPGVGAEATAMNSIGRVAVPEGVTPGTTPFGNMMHERIAAWLSENYRGTEFIIRVKPGENGIDVRYLSGPNPGWTFLEIKPQTASGLASFNTQIAKWGLPTDKTVSLTYDSTGNLFWGW